MEILYPAAMIGGLTLVVFASIGFVGWVAWQVIRCALGKKEFVECIDNK